MTESIDVRYGWPNGEDGAEPCHLLVRAGRDEFYSTLCGATVRGAFREVTDVAPPKDRTCGGCLRRLTTREEQKRRQRSRERYGRKTTVPGYCPVCKDERPVQWREGQRWGSCTVCGGTVGVGRR
jgi:hypothetical protein